MFNEDECLYTIGTVSKLVNEHPETLRVWEKNGLLCPNREEYQRKYSNNDLKRIKFIKFLIDNKGLNLAGVKQLIKLYPCWYKKNCMGGSRNNSLIPVNESKPCWKIENAYCLLITDKADLCNSCKIWKNCKSCNLNK